MFTSLHDLRYGAAGSFDTSDNGGINVAAPGNWAGVFAGHQSTASLEHAVLAYGGGSTRVEGEFRAFNTLEAHQSTFRMAHSVVERSADGQRDDGAGGNRFGRGFNEAATVFLRAGEPVLVDNIIRDNEAVAISVNVNALDHGQLVDYGSSVGPVEIYPGTEGNRGALVLDNRLQNNAINAMEVRPGTLTTEGVWDDTSIVHYVQGDIVVPDFHTFGGLRLESSSTESLVVKLSGDDAGITATGRPLDIEDRIGGMVHLLGQPGHPVVLTSVTDDSVGAGLDTLGNPALDTNNDGLPGFEDPVIQLPSPGIPFTVTPTTVPQDLVDAMLLRSLPAGVTITNSSLVSNATSAGVYDGGDSVPLQIPLTGAILSTGNAVIPASNTSSGFTGITLTPPDADLDGLIPGATTESTSLTLEIQVDPGSGIQSGSFLFQFGSEEFSEFVGSGFNDVLGGFVNGGAATNFLRDSTGSLISINNALFDIDNEMNVLNIEYDGLTVGLLAQFPLQVGTNIVKIAVGDVGDRSFDSGILMTDLQFGDEEVGTGGVTAAALPQTGDWRGIVVQDYSHDGNFVMENELEPGDLFGLNESINRSQFLGKLAPTDKSGDETLRLGLPGQRADQLGRGCRRLSILRRGRDAGDHRHRPHHARAGHRRGGAQFRRHRDRSLGQLDGGDGRSKSDLPQSGCRARDDQPVENLAEFSSGSVVHQSA